VSKRAHEPPVFTELNKFGYVSQKHHAIFLPNRTVFSFFFSKIKIYINFTDSEKKHFIIDPICD